MIRIRVVGIVLVVLGLLPLALSQPVGGGEKKTDNPDNQRKMSEGARAVQAIASAYQMAEMGRKQNAPELLIAAARIIGTNKCAPEPLPKGAKVFKALDANGIERKEAIELIAEAEKLTEQLVAKQKSGKEELAFMDPKVIKGLADETRKIVGGERSPVQGMRVWSGYFPGNDFDWHDFLPVRCRGGEYTCVSLRGQGPAGLDLDLIVTDQETGQVVASETSVGPNSSVQFWVPFTKDYTIEVRNYSRNTPCFRYCVRAH